MCWDRLIECEEPEHDKGQQPRRPRMRHVGQQLYSPIADLRDPRDRLLDRMLHVGIGTEGEFHAVSLCLLITRTEPRL